MKWYVVHTYSGFENKVKADILESLKNESETVRNAIGEILVPMEPPQQTGKRTGVRKKFFPGYILIQMDLNNETHHFIRHRPNVTGFVGNEKGPRPLSEREVEAIKNQMLAGPVKKVVEVQFEEGMAVRITDGPFGNFTGIVEEVKPEKRKLRVLVTIFGRATPVELDFGQVERI